MYKANESKFIVVFNMMCKSRLFIATYCWHRFRYLLIRLKMQWKIGELLKQKATSNKKIRTIIMK